MFCLTAFILSGVVGSSIVVSRLNDNNFNEIINNNNNNNNVFDETDPLYWYVQAYRNLKQRQYSVPIPNRAAKNVILFLGDGMGISTITASRILKGQQQLRKGEEAMLEMDHFPFTALIKVSGSLIAYNITNSKLSCYIIDL